MDGFLRAQSDVFSIGYYGKDDLAFTPHAAEAFTVYDRFFCSLLGPTYPNREYMHAAQSFGQNDNTFPSGGFPDDTIFHALSKEGVSNRYFYTDIPFSALWGAPGISRSGHVRSTTSVAQAACFPRCHSSIPLSMARGRAPPVTSTRTATCGWDRRSSRTSSTRSCPRPSGKRGALFIVYDEWGGFFDHVAPPRVPDLRSNRDINNDFGQMGFRIPAIASRRTRVAGMSTIRSTASSRS